MLTQTTVTDVRTAWQAIREAAIPGGMTPVDIYLDSIEGKRDRLSIFGLCADTYRAQVTTFVRVAVRDRFASVHFEIDPARDWCEQITDIVDWLATESPVPA